MLNVQYGIVKTKPASFRNLIGDLQKEYPFLLQQLRSWNYHNSSHVKDLLPLFMSTFR